MEINDFDVLTAQSFEVIIEDLVWEKDINHFEAVMEFCRLNSIEPLSVAKLINRTLKEKIEVDAINEGLLPRRGSLPI